MALASSRFTWRKAAFVSAGAVAAVGAMAAMPGSALAATGAAGTAQAAAAHVDNPFSGKGYVNADWSAKAKADGGSAIADQPTAVWMDQISAIEGANGAKGLAAHLDAALEQKAAYFEFVVYDLPGRDCAAVASQGELKADELSRYQSEYIDPIVKIVSDSKYAGINIVAIIEPDSLPNLVTNVGSRATATANCDTMKSNGNYQKGIAYALQKLHAVSNVYNYLDIGHHGWIGWDDNLQPTIDLMATVAKSAGGTATVDGFIANLANYGATTEPFLKLTDTNRPSKWIDWNRYVDEQSFALAFRTKAISSGFDSKIGMLIDTSRNGWGGSKRPTAAVTSGSVDAQVDGSRIDRRIHLGNWCNQDGAGIGARPIASPVSGIDAYVWVKPPGESDGSDHLSANGKGIDSMCDPAYGGNPRNNNNKSGAIGDSPISGQWFSKQFQQLVANAYPAIK